MTLRKSATRAKSRWTLLVTAVAIFSLALVSGALAVHNEDVFQLDGNAIVDAAGGAEPENPVSNQDGDHDWDEVYADHLDGTTTSGATAIAFFDDEFGQGDDILVGGGTKDINDIGPSWLWKQTAVTSVQDKADIEHAYAAQYTSGEDELLYFGADRFSNSGDTVMGFWFFKSEIATVGPDASGNGTFTGNHTARVVDPETDDVISRGDVLVVADFRSGGKAPSIQVYEWVTSGGSASTHLDQIGGSEDPAGCTESPPEKPNGAPIPPVADGDPFCATANQFEVQSPWPFTPKDNSGGMAGDGGPDTLFGVAEFMEGGINLTSLGLADQCFSTFMAETRASHSVTSTLSDFALGGFGSCETTLTTTANFVAGTSIGTGVVSSGTDSANLTITGVATWGGTLDFYLCGPIATGVCDDGGVQVSSLSVSQATAQPIASGTANLTSAGRYCWFVEFTPNTETAAAGVEGESHDGSGGTTNAECFVVAKVTPTLNTEAVIEDPENPGSYIAVPAGYKTPFGSAVYDRATLSGAATEPGSGGANTTYPTINPSVAGVYQGTIGFTLKGPDGGTPACSTTDAGPYTGETQTFPINVAVTGNAVHGPVSFTPDSPGDYHWVASYTNTGSANNTSPVTHNADCSDTDENVTVEQIPTVTTTRQFAFPQDKVKIDTNPSGLTLDGSVTFKLYGPTNGGDPKTAAENCALNGDTLGSGGLVYKEGPINISGAGPQYATTDNTTFRITDSGVTYVWRVTYTSSDPAHANSLSDCVESTTVTYAGDDSSISIP